jgi:hypothetical protein
MRLTCEQRFRLQLRPLDLHILCELTRRLRTWSRTAAWPLLPCTAENMTTQDSSMESAECYVAAHAHVGTWQSN